MFFFISIFAVAPLVMQQSFAQCVINDDWLQAPCLDVVMNGCYDSEDAKMWMKYYDYKGASHMESKRIDMNSAVEENRLQEWESQSHENFNVWQQGRQCACRSRFCGTAFTPNQHSANALVNGVENQGPLHAFLSYDGGKGVN